MFKIKPTQQHTTEIKEQKPKKAKEDSQEWDDSVRLEGKYPCIADELLKKGVNNVHSCGSSDGLSIYENTHNVLDDDGDIVDTITYYTGFCYSCRQSFSKGMFKRSSLSKDFSNSGDIVAKKHKRASKRPPLSHEDIVEIMGYGYKGYNYRGIKDEFRQFYGHAIHIWDVVDTNGVMQHFPVKEFYPETKDGVIVGYKGRVFPKSFGRELRGELGVNNDFSGQHKFKDKRFKNILIVGGEIDKVSALQMLVEWGRGGHKESWGLWMPVVASTSGEGSVASQAKSNLDFLTKANTIYVALDNDEAGRLAMEKVCAILPRERVKIVTWSKKDPNSYLWNGENVLNCTKEFIEDIRNAISMDEAGWQSLEDKC